VERNLIATHWLVPIACLLATSTAWADGGAVVLHATTAGRQITLFSSPTPLVAGPVDLSLLVTDAASGQPLLEVPIELRLRHEAALAEQTLAVSATRGEATNQLLHAAKMELPQPGRWRVTILVGEGADRATAECDLQVAPAPPPWFRMWPWYTWPAGVVVWFVWRKSHGRRGTIDVTARSD
jgi:hypothetical protein